jgi:hypothetical protein
VFVLDTSAPGQARIGWDTMTTPPTPVDSPPDSEVDLATETTAERQARFERESPKKQIMAIDVTASGPTFTTGASHLVVDARVAGWERAGAGRPYAITPDGERFLVSNAVETAQPITLIFNWPSKLTVR